jgi:hypothetical protein
MEEDYDGRGTPLLFVHLEKAMDPKVFFKQYEGVFLCQISTPIPREK